MNSEGRQYYAAGYSKASYACLLVNGPPPCDHHFVDIESWTKYKETVIAWWLSTQNPGTRKQRGYRFFKYYMAWWKDKKRKGEHDGRI